MKWTKAVLLSLFVTFSAIPTWGDCVIADPINFFQKETKGEVKKALLALPQTLVVETYTGAALADDKLVEIAHKRALRYSNAIVVIITEKPRTIVVVSSDDKDALLAAVILEVMTAYLRDGEKDEALRAAEKLVFWRIGTIVEKKK